MRNLIAVIGPLRSGKDSIADALAADFGFRQLSLAGALKEEVVAALNAVDVGTTAINGVEVMPWSLERLEAEKTRLRPLLQVWGTEFRRAQDPNYWVRQLEARINDALSFDPNARLIVTDARFTNELDMLVEAGFDVISLSMPESVLRDHLHVIAGMSDEQIDKALAHPSEWEWKKYPADYVVNSVPGHLPELIDAVKGYILK